jgi:hypothetical protein
MAVPPWFGGEATPGAVAVANGWHGIHIGTIKLPGWNRWL